jgi:hypothetical protein
MPRSNRPRRSSESDETPLALERILAGRSHTESKRDGLWNVQPHGGRGSRSRSYVCPGCGLEIRTGTAHIVAWRADGILGEVDDLAGRRHWHDHCWRIRV